jgi:transcription elongation factor GreA
MTGETYLTQLGAEKFREELERLKGQVREQLAKRLRAAIQQGDLSENADYTSAKEEQSFVEGRILELESMLKDVIIIDDLPKNIESVQIGSTVTLQEKEGELETYTLVGPQEANPLDGKISNESPIGQSLMNHHKGEKVKIITPQGPVELIIINIE